MVGVQNMILEADNGFALVSLVNDVIVATHHRGSDETKVKHETSVAYDSQSNGGTEVGVRNVRGLFRTLKACLEERVKHYVPPGHALIPWVLQHC